MQLLRMQKGAQKQKQLNMSVQTPSMDVMDYLSTRARNNRDNDDGQYNDLDMIHKLCYSTFVTYTGRIVPRRLMNIK